MVQHFGIHCARSLYLRKREPYAARCLERRPVQHGLLYVQELHRARKIQIPIPCRGLQSDEYADVRGARRDFWNTDVRPGDGHGLFSEAARRSIRTEAAILIAEAIYKKLIVSCQAREG